MTLRSGNRCDSCRCAVRNSSAWAGLANGTDDYAAVGAPRAVVHAAHDYNFSERRVHPSRRLHKDSIALLPQPSQQQPLHLAHGCIKYTAGRFRRRQQLWDCSQLHLPCRWGNPSVRCREGRRELQDWAAEQQQPMRLIALHRAQ